MLLKAYTDSQSNPLCCQVPSPLLLGYDSTSLISTAGGTASTSIPTPELLVPIQ